MIIEQQLEKQIIDAIRSDEKSVYYSGAWDECASGAVKGEEPADIGATVAVTVSQMRSGTYGEGEYLEIEIPVEITCCVPANVDPTGKTLLDLYERTSGKVWDWARFQTSEEETELTVCDEDGDVVFAPGGVARDAGPAPVYGFVSKCWTWTIGFMVKGILN